MSECPDNLKYTESHEWVKVEDDGIATVGITDYAQSQLGDLVFVELPMIEDEMMAGCAAGVVESVKTASDIISPVSGQVVAINEALTAEPGTVNEDPYEKGWMFRVKMGEPSEVDGLLNADDYQAKIDD